MAQFADTLNVFKLWCAHRHKTERTTRLNRLAMLAIRNGWALQPKMFNPIRVHIKPDNPYGVAGISHSEQLELLYYDGFVAGLALASGNLAEFYGAVWQIIKAQCEADYKAAIEQPGAQIVSLPSDNPNQQ